MQKRERVCRNQAPPIMFYEDVVASATEQDMDQSESFSAFSSGVPLIR